MAPERYDQAWYPGEAIAKQVPTERGGKTTLTMTPQYGTREARDGVLKSPMEQGMTAAFSRLAVFLASMR